MKKYELIIFDCDGTLVDTEVIFRDATKHTLAALGHKDIGCQERFVGVDKESFVKLLKAELGEDFDHFSFEKLLIERCREMIPTSV
jgi:beta-phosphoglucomutase-like phosphatase (HAD superfamily)